MQFRVEGDCSAPPTFAGQVPDLNYILHGLLPPFQKNGPSNWSFCFERLFTQSNTSLLQIMSGEARVITPYL